MEAAGERITKRWAIESMTDLRVLTFNVWMLPAPLPGTNRRRRLDRIVAALRDVDADIVAIQEAFDPWARRALTQELSDRYETNDGVLEMRRSMGLAIDRTGGLLILSKLPICHASFTSHPLPLGAKLPERVACKGVLHTAITTPAGRLDVLNVHFYAGGKRADRAVRTTQLHHLSRMLGSTTDSVPLIVTGDFNAWPDPGESVHQRAQPEYRFLQKIGLLHAKDGDPAATRITYDVDRNPLAAFWSSKKQGGQEFDSIFYRSSATRTIEVTKAAVVLNEEKKPLSDHYGYLAELRLSSAIESSHRAQGSVSTSHG